MIQKHYLGMNIIKAGITVFKRQINLAWANKFLHINAIAFYIICISVFNIAIGPYQLEESVKIALLFTPLILAMMLNSSSLVEDDYKTGILHQLLLIPSHWVTTVIAKTAAFISIYAMAIIMVFPLVCIILDINSASIPYLVLVGITLICFITPILLLSSSMTLGLNINILSSILTLPLVIPALILSTLSYNNSSYFWLLTGLTAISLPITIFLSKHLLTEMVKTD